MIDDGMMPTEYRSVTALIHTPVIGPLFSGQHCLISGSPKRLCSPLTGYKVLVTKSRMSIMSRTGMWVWYFTIYIAPGKQPKPELVIPENYPEG